MEKIEKIEKIKPSGIFTNYIFKAIPLAFDESLSYYEMLCGLLKKVKTIEEVVNNHADVIKELEEFVTHYFDNLDVQEEINNKLDDMAESGELAEIINEQLFNQLNEEVENNKINQLVENIQCLFYNKLQDVVLDDYGIGSIYINENNKGIAIENDFSSGGSGGTKFKVVTFDYVDGNPVNVITRTALLDGHANSICDLGDNKVLICSNGYNYIYNLFSNYCYPIESDLPYFSGVSNYNNTIYAIDFYTGKLYTLDVDTVNNTASVTSTQTINDLFNKMGGNTQGMVIYNNLLLFPSYAPCKLVIYDLNTLQHIKTQLFSAPYLVEYEDGFVYNNELYLVDSVAGLYKPDIYGKNYIGGTYLNNITRSNTDVILFDDSKVINFNTNNVIPITKYVSYMNSNTNTDIGTVGAMFESLTLYFTITNVGSITGIQLAPAEVMCFKALQNSNLVSKQDNVIINFANNFNTTGYYYESDKVKKQTIFGTISFGGSSTIPTLTINPNKNILFENFTDDEKEIIDGTETLVTLCLIKIVGHRKVGTKY